MTTLLGTANTRPAPATPIPDAVVEDTATAAWFTDRLIVEAGPGTVAWRCARARDATPQQARRLADIFAVAAHAAAGQPVLWHEYRALCHGPRPYPVSPAISIWHRAPCPQSGFDVVQSTFDLEYLHEWTNAYSAAGRVVIIESRVWTALTEHSPWTRCPALPPLPTGRCRP
ncbi:hypothetical protein [Nocardia transvalensis]|uniref:hypothetical protein n=1 Tax=Nocardia transvalensis TaxID=37333 RepID=UPI001895CE71|nr:hypothetical protein [Nocardia transvalensis]MBF6333626.1 hypothetical protein [Nocardia transvalensis]